MVQPKSVRQVMPIPETSGNCGVSLPRIPVVQRSVRAVDCPSMLKPDNVRDHRAGTNDHPFLNHAQVRLRVHRFVIQTAGQRVSRILSLNIHETEEVAKKIRILVDCD